MQRWGTLLITATLFLALKLAIWRTGLVLTPASYEKGEVHLDKQAVEVDDDKLSAVAGAATPV